MAMSSGVRRLAGWSNLLLGAALAFALWGIAVMVTSHPSVRAIYDLSPQQSFSLAPQTRDLLEDLRERASGDEEFRLEIHYYPMNLRASLAQTAMQRYQRQLRAQIQSYTRDLLELIDARTGAAVHVETHDPYRHLDRLRSVAERFKGLSEGRIAVKMTGQPVKLLSVVTDMADIDVGGGQGLPAGQAPPSLRSYKGEEALVSAVRGLMAGGGQAKVYFVMGFHHNARMMLQETSPLGYSALRQSLEEEGFAVDTLRLDAGGRIPEDASLLALLEPGYPIREDQAELLAGYVRQGGRLFINFAYSEIPDKNVPFDALGRRLGFEVGRDLLCRLVPDPLDPDQFRVGHRHNATHVIRDFNPRHPLTRPLVVGGREVVLGAARELRRRGEPGGDIAVDPSLLVTSPETWIERGAGGRVDHRPPEDVEFAQRSVGMVIDVHHEDFEEAGRGHVVLLGGRALHNSTFGNNRDLGLNIFNWLASREALVTVRGKKYSATHLQVEPARLERIGWLVQYYVPGALLLSGLIVFWWRRRT